MEEQEQKAVYMGVEMVVVVVLITFALTTIFLCRVGYTNMERKYNVATSLKACKEYEDYISSFNQNDGTIQDRPVDWDTCINFMVTFGDNFKYILNDDNHIYLSDNVDNSIVDRFKAKLTIDEIALIESKALSSVSFELLRDFPEFIRDDSKFRIMAYSFEGERLNMSTAGTADIILIEKMR